MHYLKQINYLKLLFFLCISLFFLFKYPTQADAVCFFSDSDCAPDEVCSGVICTKILDCETGFCTTEGQSGSTSIYDRCITGFHYNNHTCIQDFVCDDSNVGPPENYNAFPGSILETCYATCGAQCKINSDCPVAGSTCSGCLCYCPAPANLVCTWSNPTTVRGDWTPSAPFSSYLLEACPSGQPPTSGTCIQNPSLTGGMFNFVNVSPGSYSLYVKVQTNTGGACSGPGNWSAAAACPTPTPTVPPPPTDTPTPTPTSGPCSNITGRIWIDDGRGGGIADNGAQDGGEVLYTLSTLTVTAYESDNPSNQRAANTDTGNYSIVNLCSPPWDVIFTVPSGYRMAGLISQFVFGSPVPNVINFSIFPLAGPTPTPPPPAVCSTVCDSSPCTQASGQPGAWQLTYTSCGVGCCSFASQTCVGPAICPVPTPSCVSAGGICGGASPCCSPLTCMPADIYGNRSCANVPTSTPAPTAIPACPGGTTERTVTSTGVSAQPCSLKGAGASCIANSECCSNNCDGIYFTCAAPPALPSSSYSYDSCSGKNSGVACGITGSKFTAVAQNNNIHLWSYISYLLDGFSRAYGSVEHELGAAFNFNGFNIPKSSFIRSATVTSPTSGGFQAGFINGNIGFLFPNTIESKVPGYTASTAMFGSGKIIPFGCADISAPWCKSFRSGWTDYSNYCGALVDPNLTIGTSGLPSGTGIVTNFVQNAVNAQTLTELGFALSPDYVQLYMTATCNTVDIPSGNFTVNTTGPAQLSITYCEGGAVSTPTPLPGTPTPTPTPTITPTPAPGTYIITGLVFLDTVIENGALDPGELGFSGATVRSTTGPTVATTTTNATGNYTLVNLTAGLYAVTLTVPAGYVATTSNPFPPSPGLLILPPSSAASFGIKPVVAATPTPTRTPTPTPTPTPIPTYTVTGIVFIDTNENGTRDVTELGYNGASVNASGPSPKTAITNATGNYTMLNLLGGSYSFSVGIPLGYYATTPTPTSRFIASNSAVNFGIAPFYTITGRVFIDTNENQAQDAGELGFAGAIVRATGPTTATATTNGAVFPISNFTLANLTVGSYTVSLSPVPAGYFVTTNPISRTLGPSTTAYIGIAASHSISGNVFVDSNGSKLKDGAEINYTLGLSRIEVRRSGVNCTGALVTGFPNPINTPNGAFTTGNILVTGEYYLCYMSKPLGYIMTFPLGQPGNPYMNQSVGFPCILFTQGGTTPGSCDALGNITNANFGINFANPWFSSRGVDLRVDDGFDDLDIPASAIPPYASLNGSGGMPGVIFSGDENADFGPFGQASGPGFRWVVGSFSFPELYTPPILNTIKTSYAYLSAVAAKSDLTPVSISASCGGNIANCTLNLPADPGLFIANGPLTIVNLSYSIPSGQDYVILVNGNLTLRGEIHVPVGSTLTFSVNGDIIVDRSVGSPASSATPDLEGLYSADGDFITGGNDDCAIGADLRLNIAGTIVTNAALLGGSLQKQRNLCIGNVSNPAVFITERPDFVLNSPLFIQSTQTIWQEVAP